MPVLPAPIRLVALFVLATLALTLPATAENRTLSFFNTHTKETLTITFKRNGRYDRAALQKLNWFLRDWRRDEKTRMDPALLDLVWTVYRKVGAKNPIWVVSGYRSPVTNNMLRKRSRGVAKFSQHMRGKAMDFYIPGVKLSKLRETAMKLQRGGVGYYPTSRSPFVHLDTGRVRHWPRMSRQQLVRLFPDGKTLHIPRDGKPLKGYKLALAEAKRSKAGGRTRLAYASGSSGSGSRKHSGSGAGRATPSSGRTFLAALFTGGGGERRTAGARTVPKKRVQQELRNFPPRQVTATKSAGESATRAAERPSAPLPENLPPPQSKPVSIARLDDAGATPRGTPAEATPDAASATGITTRANVEAPAMALLAPPRPLAKPRAAQTAVTRLASVEPGIAATPLPKAATSPAPAAISAGSIPIPQHNPYRLIASTTAGDVPRGGLDLPLPPHKPMIVASLGEDRGNIARPLTPTPPLPDAATGRSPALLARSAPGLAGLAAGATASLAGHHHPTLPLLAFNGSDLGQLTGKHSTRTRAYAQLSAPVTAYRSLFEAPRNAIENRFDRYPSQIPAAETFSGPAIRAIRTVWLDESERR